MNESVLLMESLRLMAIGMGIVFSFLVLLVGVLRGMSWLAFRLAPGELHAVASGLSSAPDAASDQLQSNDLIAVISTAIAYYRARH